MGLGKYRNNQKRKKNKVKEYAVGDHSAEVSPKKGLESAGEQNQFS